MEEKKEHKEHKVKFQVTVFNLELKMFLKSKKNLIQCL